MDAPEIWIENDFVPASQELYEHLSLLIKWDERMQARKTASFGLPYNYSGMTYPEAPFPEPIQHILERLNARLGYESNNCLANYYPTGKSSMRYHVDSTAELETGTGIAVISLGAERFLAFRRITDKLDIHQKVLPSGSLLFMSAATQEHWKHGLLKCSDLGGRISLTFRRIKPIL